MWSQSPNAGSDQPKGASDRPEPIGNSEAIREEKPRQKAERQIGRIRGGPGARIAPIGIGFNPSGPDVVFVLPSDFCLLPMLRIGSRITAQRATWITMQVTLSRESFAKARSTNARAVSCGAFPRPSIPASSSSRTEPVRAVRGQQEAVADRQVEDADRLGPFAGLRAAEEEVEVVAELVPLGLLGLDRAGRNQGAGEVVILGETLQAAVSEAVGPGVADVGDVGPIRPEEGEDHRGSPCSRTRGSCGPAR